MGRRSDAGAILLLLLGLVLLALALSGTLGTHLADLLRYLGVRAAGDTQTQVTSQSGGGGAAVPSKARTMSSLASSFGAVPVTAAKPATSKRTAAVSGMPSPVGGGEWAPSLQGVLRGLYGGGGETVAPEVAPVG